jgi:hypothetical protein
MTESTLPEAPAAVPEEPSAPEHGNRRDRRVLVLLVAIVVVVAGAGAGFLLLHTSPAASGRLPAAAPAQPSGSAGGHSTRGHTGRHSSAGHHAPSPLRVYKSSVGRDPFAPLYVAPSATASPGPSSAPGSGSSSSTSGTSGKTSGKQGGTGGGGAAPTPGPKASIGGNAS